MEREYIDIHFDGPPGNEPGRFVEVVGPDGKSFDAGEWIKVDGEPLWALRIKPAVFGGIHLVNTPKPDPIGWGHTGPLAFPDVWGPIKLMQGMVQLENPGGLSVEEKHPQLPEEIGVRVPLSCIKCKVIAIAKDKKGYPAVVFDPHWGGIPPAFSMYLSTLKAINSKSGKLYINDTPCTDAEIDLLHVGDYITFPSTL